MNSESSFFMQRARGSPSASPQNNYTRASVNVCLGISLPPRLIHTALPDIPGPVALAREYQTRAVDYATVDGGVAVNSFGNLKALRARSEFAGRRRRHRRK